MSNEVQVHKHWRKPLDMTPDRETILSNAAPYPLDSYLTLAALEPPRMLVDGLIVVESITGLSSAPGVGKTWLILEIMRAVAFSGMRGARPCLGKLPVVPHPSEKPLSVLFVGSDASIFDYAYQERRLIHEEWQQHYDEEIAEYGGTLINDRMKFLIHSGFSFDNPNEVDRLIATSRSYTYGSVPLGMYEGVEVMSQPHSGFDLIIFDTFASMNNLDRNDNTLMEGVYRAVRQIADETGAAILLTNHSTKSDDDWIGAISQVGRLDGLLRLTRVKGSKDLREIKFKKFRGITPPDIKYRMNVSDPTTASLVFDSFATDPGTADDAAGDRDMVLAELATGPKTTRELVAVKQSSFTRAKSEDAASRALRRALAGLVDEGLVIKFGGADPSAPTVWELKNEPAILEEHGRETVQEHDHADAAEAPGGADGRRGGGPTRPRRNTVRPAGGARKARARGATKK